jgi:CRP/FNR family transcriptional regulator, cyclic AMP receptor protein
MPSTLPGMVAQSDYLKHLASVPLFAALSPKDLQKLARVSDEVTIEAGRELVKQGTTGREAYVIVEGEAEVIRGEQVLATLGAGEAFGELALLDGGPRTASVKASTNLTVLVLGQREFGGIIEEVPGIAHKILANLASRIRELDDKIYG